MVGEQVGAEIFVDHPFPGIELKDIPDGFVLQVDKGFGVGVPADLIDEERLRVQAGLDGAVAEVFSVGEVFEGVFYAGELKQSGMEVGLEDFPVGDEFFVDAIELIAVFIEVLEPEPLYDACLIEAGRSVCVELEEF